ncbi:uncharacterized protein Z520_00950 [Fonsecaea multimorphosa CBS 102226]|uniref:J domain-containing protein n=1 Tax=Fonsecaea multimorphosa CBS 102226 TaxID=1442371 RepID=A0A0D2KGC4_9EURO|nr:uncharacterized protein Z520_00950 [Fonsecaea multimorphosa CBS 102226]KIY02485.1 hypothetical protein Z520_00950 [Fonsecaea multimorphosa CBS 102226]OAL31287.1 hypothetical protein AYO22_01190 [Fonsecaea multimorphosa]
MANHYSVLGVSPDATHQQIKAAYNKLVLQHHPDKGGSQAEFIQIQTAWEVLRDPAARANYDRQCRSRAGENAQRPRHHGQHQRASGAQFPRDQPNSGRYHHDSMPGGYYSDAGSGSRRGPSFNSWNGFRESSAGSAYNSYYGSSAGAASDRDRNPRASSTPEPEDNSRHQPRNAQTNNQDFHSRSRRRDHTDSPPYSPQSSSPPPTMPTELDLKAVKALAVEASRNLERYKHLISTLRSSTRSRPLLQETQIKLEHVHLLLQTRELKLKQRVTEIKMYNINVQNKTPPEKLEPFFVSLWETILKEDKEAVTDVNSSASRVMRDASQWLRRREVLEARGLEFTEDDRLARDLKDSTEALERLLTKVLLSAPGAAPPRSY